MKLRSMHAGRQAFTLVELLVVIAIIGLLSTVAVVATNGSRSKSRDAKRLADLHQLKNAIDLYISDNGVAPQCGQANCTTPIASWGDLANLAIKPTYIASIPTDPIGLNGQYGYYYVAGLKATGACTFAVAKSEDYFLATRLENPNGVAGSCPGGVASAWNNTSINFLLSD